MTHLPWWKLCLVSQKTQALSFRKESHTTFSPQSSFLCWTMWKWLLRGTCHTQRISPPSKVSFSSLIDPGKISQVETVIVGSSVRYCCICIKYCPWRSQSVEHRVFQAPGLSSFRSWYSFSYPSEKVFLQWGSQCYLTGLNRSGMGLDWWTRPSSACDSQCLWLVSDFKVLVVGCC